MAKAPYGNIRNNPAHGVIPVSTGQSLNCDAFFTSAAATVTFVDLDGNTVTGFPATAGYNPFGVQSFSNLGGASIWALYTS